MAEPEFTRGPARRPAPTVEDPILQWASGLTTQDRKVYAGWMLEAGKFEDLDISMHEAGFGQVTIKHGSGAVVTHWAIEVANAFVIAEGVQSRAELRGDARIGIAYTWRRTDSGRPQSVLRARVMLRELLAVGYMDPLVISVKSTFTDDVMTALNAHYAVLDQIDAFRALDGKSALHSPFYACCVPLGPGADVERGTGNNKKTVAPIVEQIPVPITKEYIRAAWCKREWAARIEELFDDTIAWSIAESARLHAGDDAAPAHEDAPPAAPYRADTRTPLGQAPAPHA